MPARDSPIALQIKTFQGLDHGNHVLAIARGVVDIDGFKDIFDRVIAATRSLLDCRVFIDLEDSTIKLLPADVVLFMDGFGSKDWPQNNRVALVSAQDVEQYRQLSMLGEGLLKLNLRFGVFYDTKEALTWLADLR